MRKRWKRWEGSLPIPMMELLVYHRRMPNSPLSKLIYKMDPDRTNNNNSPINSRRLDLQCLTNTKTVNHPRRFQQQVQLLWYMKMVVESFYVKEGMQKERERC